MADAAKEDVDCDIMSAWRTPLKSKGRHWCISGMRRKS